MHKSTLVLICAALLTSNAAFAEHHHGGGGGGGGGGGFSIFFGPYDEPYYEPYYGPYQEPYYYHRRTIVVNPQYSHASKAVTADSVQTMKAQVQLESLGYYNGAVDGIIGPQTQRAIMSFQHDKGLSETGVLDAPTLKALGIPND